MPQSKCIWWWNDASPGFRWIIYVYVKNLSTSRLRRAWNIYSHPLLWNQLACPEKGIVDSYMILTHWDRDKMATIWQKIFSNAFSLKKNRWIAIKISLTFVRLLIRLNIYGSLAFPEKFNFDTESSYGLSKCRISIIPICYTLKLLNIVFLGDAPHSFVISIELVP